jgi:hypothetical protein
MAKIIYIHMKYYFSLHKSVYYMRLKLTVAQLLLESLSEQDAFADLGYKGTIKLIVAQIKLDTVNLQGKEKEMRKMTDKKTGTINENMFDDWIMSVGKYLGYQIRRNEMLLSEFLSANKAMVKELEIMSKGVKRK